LTVVRNVFVRITARAIRSVVNANVHLAILDQLAIMFVHLIIMVKTATAHVLIA